MDTALIPVLLALAVLAPLAAFFINLIAGKYLQFAASVISMVAILFAAAMSYLSLGLWLTEHYPVAHHDHGHHEAGEHAGGDHEKHAGGHAGDAEAHSRAGGEGHKADAHKDPEHKDPEHKDPEHKDPEHKGAAGSGSEGEEGDDGHGGHHAASKPHLTGVYYVLGTFGDLRMNISYYIDMLTLVMFCMVTLIASCIHLYAIGYMHEELHDVTDHEVTNADGTHLHRPGRFHRFFQALSLFCFSMLGLVLAGNIAMVFVFWELVGICSYFLIGFYVERNSASTAANKAFIVNRVGDFGMIIGLLAVWSALGTFSFGDLTVEGADGEKTQVAGIFSQVRSPENGHQLIGSYKDAEGNVKSTPHTPSGFVRMGAYSRVQSLVLKGVHEGKTHDEIEATIEAKVPMWRDPAKYAEEIRHELATVDKDGAHAEEETAALKAKLAEAESHDGAYYGYWLLIIAGLGIFCGCVGKSAQFPLHVWLPDAMEGPTPVSALVHSATMVAAGVYLVGRFYPVFTPETLTVISTVGAITLFMAATIAITATDIKRVLAYSTVSQLGYMMLALGLGGWVAGLMHLITHAFFKSLLFMGSGSVIHAVHSNEMTDMGGLLKKMPITAITMLIGCLAIIGASIPFVVGLSGYYSKDAILEQAYLHMQVNGSPYAALFFAVAAGGAAITAFYMFRMWFMTFLGQPRDQAKYDHAHESPYSMTVPLMITAFFAVTVAWTPFGIFSPEAPGGGTYEISLANMLEQARPLGAVESMTGPLWNITIGNEHESHDWAIKAPVTILAFMVGIAGVALAASFYWLGYIDPAEVKKQFSFIHKWLVNKWYFDELYNIIFIKPTLMKSRMFAAFDLRFIDGLLHFIANSAKRIAVFWAWFADKIVVDGAVNGVAGWFYSTGTSLRKVQTGNLRQYVLFIVIGAIAITVLTLFIWNPVVAGK